MFGKKLQEYVQFERWILILIAAAFLVRLAMSLAGTPLAVNRWASINIVLLVGLVYCAVAVHTSGFGSYKQLYGLYLLQGGFAHVLIAVGIVLAIVMGTDNIYTVPEYFGGNSGRNWVHAIIHAVAGFVLFPTVMWPVGAAILFVTKKVSR
jgi:hypothetical protein